MYMRLILEMYCQCSCNVLTLSILGRILLLHAPLPSYISILLILLSHAKNIQNYLHQNTKSSTCFQPSRYLIFPSYMNYCPLQNIAIEFQSTLHHTHFIHDLTFPLIETHPLQPFEQFRLPTAPRNAKHFFSGANATDCRDCRFPHTSSSPPYSAQ